MFRWKTFRAKKLDDVIFIADSYIFHWELEKIIEVTYSYRETEDGFLINETLFEEYLWLQYPKYDIATLTKKYKHKIKKQIHVIDNIIKKTSKIKVESRIEWLRKTIFCDAMDYVKNILHISLLWVDFEAEKAWLTLILNEKDTHSILAEIEKREKEAFGKKIIEDPEEFALCYNFVKKNHENKKTCDYVKECKKMSSYLKKIKKAAGGKVMKTPDIQRKLLRGDFLKKNILRKDYRKVFDMVCELYWLTQRTQLTSAGSIYDGDNFLEIPRHENYKQLPLWRLLQLLTHEIESHYINSFNGKILIGNFRWAKNLPKEEWLAMFMEKIFTGYTYDNIDNIVEEYFTIMAWEALEWDDFWDFMRIMEKEYKLKRASKSAIIRAKRNYSMNHSWVQHKDTVYFRGLLKIITYLKSWGQFRKLFLWKVWMQDVENLYNIYHLHDNKQDIVFPIFISDLIYYMLLNKQKNKKFEFEVQEYYLYLKKKYWFIDLDCFNIIDQINENDKKISSIIKLIEKSLI